MPWKESAVMSQQENFIAEALQKEQSFSALCRAYGISRKTGYKWLAHAQSEVPLEELSRRPTHSPARTPAALETLILEVRDSYPTWGLRKLERWLQDHGYEDLPSKTTIESILKRQGRIAPAEASTHTAWKPRIPTVCAIFPYILKAFGGVRPAKVGPVRPQKTLERRPWWDPRLRCLDDAAGYPAHPRTCLPSTNPGQDRTFSPHPQE